MEAVKDILAKLMPYIIQGFGAAAVFLFGKKISLMIQTLIEKNAQRKNFLESKAALLGKIFYYFFMTITVLVTINSFFSPPVRSVAPHLIVVV